MCGIIGFTGKIEAKTLLIDGLARLEYRGYDSAGIALQCPDKPFQIIKKAGKVETLRAAAQALDESSTCGIGHTRWATHGGVTDANAHPHVVGRVALIHNGIIENYHELIEKFNLSKVVKSETDTEVAAAVINYFYKGDPYYAIRQTMKHLVGSFAFCIMFEDIPDKIFAIRNVSPMVAAHFDDGSMVASDLTALIQYTQQYFIIPEYHIVTLTKDEIKVETLDGQLAKPELLTVSWNIEAAQKGGYEYYMMKEIMEQPEVIRNTIMPRIENGLPTLLSDGVDDETFRDINAIRVIACGTAMHAGMIFKSMVEPMMRIPVTVSIASEYRYDSPIIDAHTLVIAVSQSGETIDTLEALKLSKSYGAKTLSVVNVKGSTIARESDYVVYTHAGPEIAVASTKAYTVQIATLYVVGCRIGLVKGCINEETARKFISDLMDVIPAVQSILDHKEEIQNAAQSLLEAQDAFFIGRGIDYTLSLEGALKLKEISYIHAEAYAAGELKHGTIALITPGVPVIAIATQRKVLSKTISNIKEVASRGADVILITEEGIHVPDGICKLHLTIPETEDVFSVFPAAVILQLIAYYTSYGRGLDVDMPRNLAKSVTVE
jgi:glucosamine--fructose-6-phosphate aminotransferase (isomerizing)